MGDRRDRPCKADAGASDHATIERLVAAVEAIDRMWAWGTAMEGPVLTGYPSYDSPYAEAARESIRKGACNPDFLRAVYSLAYFPPYEEDIFKLEPVLPAPGYPAPAGDVARRILTTAYSYGMNKAGS